LPYDSGGSQSGFAEDLNILRSYAGFWGFYDSNTSCVVFDYLAQKKKEKRCFDMSKTVTPVAGRNIPKYMNHPSKTSRELRAY